MHQPQLFEAHEADAGGQLGGQIHTPDVLQAAESDAVEEEERRAEHGKVMPAPHRPDEACPEQQHEGQPAVVGDAPHLQAGRNVAPRLGSAREVPPIIFIPPPPPAPYHHGDEGTDVALFHDDVAQGVQGQPLRRTPPAWPQGGGP